MVNTIKWELMKWYYRLRWVVFFTFVVLGIFLMLTVLGAFNTSNTFTDYLLKGISLLLTTVVLFFCVLAPSVNMLIDYILPHKYMERTVRRNHQTIILANIIVNAIIFYIGVCFEVLMNLVFKIIPNGAMYSSNGSKGVSIFLYLIFGLLIPLIVLFFYMLTYCIKADIKHRILVMIILMIITFGVLYLLSKVTLIDGAFEGGIFGILLVASLSIVIDRYEPR